MVIPVPLLSVDKLIMHFFTLPSYVWIIFIIVKIFHKFMLHSFYVVLFSISTHFYLSCRIV